MEGILTIELALLVLVIIFCAGITYGRGRPSGKTTVTRPSDKNVDGMGGIRAYDYSYVNRGKAYPVGLRQERKRTATFKEPRRRKEKDRHK
jgi:hypothetical protein